MQDVRLTHGVNHAERGKGEKGGHRRGGLSETPKAISGSERFDEGINQDG